MAGKGERIALITGATGGIGGAIAAALARGGMTVVLVARDRGRGEAVAGAIRTAGGRASLLEADLSSQASIRRLAEAFQANNDHLDVLVNSAAVFNRQRTTTADGLETMFATNHLSYFLLTNLLIDSLRAAARAHVLNITAPSTVQLNFDDLQGTNSFNALNAFGASKMANLLFTFDLARRLEGSGVNVNAIHPGIVKSDLMRQAPAPLRWLTAITGKTPDRSAGPIVEVATSPAYAAQSGRFFKDGKEISADPYAFDTEVQRRLWEASVALTAVRDIS